MSCVDSMHRFFTLGRSKMFGNGISSVLFLGCPFCVDGVKLQKTCEVRSLASAICLVFKLRRRHVNELFN